LVAAYRIIERRDKHLSHDNVQGRRTREAQLERPTCIFESLQSMKSPLPIIETCDGCGACCLEQGHPPFTNDERDRVPYELLAPIDEYLASLESDDFGQPCIWLDPDTKRCGHYEHRPQVCRDFERGSELCMHVRLRFRIR
jgi:uncharacterized protein